MEKSKKMVKAITSRDTDFAQWYTDIVKQAEMVDYSSVQGFMNLLPNGYGIWELIVSRLDGYFKETGHQNVYLPLLIPESLLNKEKAHVTGFAPEVAWVTHGGSEELQERLCVRPTSETLFCDLYARIVQSYRDLPKLYNQWNSVVRWEKTTRPFLRTREFLWQEGHTIHETGEESLEETLKILDIYEKMLREDMAIPVIKGQKTEKEKFAGAMNTYAVESIMYDGKALQTATSHDFGDSFAKCFEVTYTDRNNELKYVHQSSWGLSTRTIGALIMVHGDDDGLVVPPRIAPVQVAIIPIGAHTGGVILEKANEINDRLKKHFRTFLDTSDKSPGWKFSLHEMRGAALRLELGPKDLEKNSCVAVRRDNRQKYIVSLDELETKIPEILEEMQNAMLEKATSLLNSKIYTALNMDDFKKILTETPGFIKAMWCGKRECEEDIKEQTGATSRVIPFEQEHLSDTCFCCGGKGEKMVFWGKAY